MFILKETCSLLFYGNCNKFFSCHKILTRIWVWRIIIILSFFAGRVCTMMYLIHLELFKVKNNQVILLLSIAQNAESDDGRRNNGKAVYWTSGVNKTSIEILNCQKKNPHLWNETLRLVRWDCCCCLRFQHQNINPAHMVIQKQEGISRVPSQSAHTPQEIIHSHHQKKKENKKNRKLLSVNSPLAWN